MLAYNESAHAFFKFDPTKGEYPNLVLFAIWDQRSEEQSASDEYGRFIGLIERPGHATDGRARSLYLTAVSGYPGLKK